MSRRRAQTPQQAVETAAIVNSVVSVSTLVSELRELTPTVQYSTSWRRKLANEELYKTANSYTPYGTVCQEAEALGKDGALKIFYASPFALLSHAAESSDVFLFLRFLKKKRLIDVCYDLDTAKPGHYARTDTARSTQCVYWTILQFPSWFRSRRNGWIPFAYVTVKSLDGAVMTDGMLVRYVVNTFDSSMAEVSFSKGFGVRGADGNTVVIRANRQLMLADWEQHVKTFSLKGPNGIVPCGVCKNVVGRCRPFHDPYLVHIHSSEYHRFDKHTPESFTELAHRIKHIAENSPGDLRMAEMTSG